MGKTIYESLFGGGPNAQLYHQMGTQHSQMFGTPRIDLPTPPPTAAPHPSKLQRAFSVVQFAMGAKALATGIQDTVLPAVSPLIPPQVGNFTAGAAKAAYATVEPILETVSPMFDTAARVSGTVLEGASDFFGYAKTVFSWGAWGFNLLPAGAKFGLGVITIAGAIYLWRGGWSSSHIQQNVQQNVNVNINMPPQMGSCAATTKKDGPNIVVDMECQQANQTIDARKLWTGAGHKVQSMLEEAPALHAKLQAATKDQLALLSTPTREYANEVLENFDKIKCKNYADPSVISLVPGAKNLLPKVDHEIKEYTRRIVMYMKDQISK